MGAVQKISIAVTEELAADIEAAIATGDYATTSEVVHDALRTWRHTRAMRNGLIAELSAAWKEGVASDAFAPLDAEDIKANGRKRLGAA